MRAYETKWNNKCDEIGNLIASCGTFEKKLTFRSRKWIGKIVHINYHFQAHRWAKTNFLGLWCWGWTILRSPSWNFKRCRRLYAKVTYCCTFWKKMVRFYMSVARSKWLFKILHKEVFEPIRNYKKNCSLTLTIILTKTNTILHLPPSDWFQIRLWSICLVDVPHICLWYLNDKNANMFFSLLF